MLYYLVVWVPKWHDSCMMSVLGRARSCRVDMNRKRTNRYSIYVHMVCIWYVLCSHKEELSTIPFILLKMKWGDRRTMMRIINKYFQLLHLSEIEIVVDSSTMMRTKHPVRLWWENSASYIIYKTDAGGKFKPIWIKKRKHFFRNIVTNSMENSQNVAWKSLL